MSETNHASKAEKLVGLAMKTNDTANALSIAQVATAEATLALVEQQRTANVIAYWAAMTDEKAGYLDDEEKARFRSIQESIEEGLGL